MVARPTISSPRLITTWRGVVKATRIAEGTARFVNKSGRELAPFGQSGSAVMFKNITAVQMALVVEKVMDRGMDGGKILEGAGVPELGHRFFSPSERLVRILCPIVKPAAAFLAGWATDNPHRRTV